MNENLKKFISMLNEEQKKQSQTAAAQEHVEPQQPTLIETVSAPVISSSLSGPELLAARLSKKPIVEEQTDPLVPLNQKFVTFKEMNDHYGLFLQRIQQQLASLGGGGEVKFARLDDINRSSVGTNKYLTYNSVTGKFDFTAVATGEGIELDGNNRVALSVATTTTLGGIKLGPGVELNGLDQIVINPEGLDFSFGDFYAYTAPGPNGNTAAYLSSINDNEDIIIASNGTGQVDVVGRFRIFTTEAANNITSASPVFVVNDDGDISATTLNIVNRQDLGLMAPLNVSINEQGLTKTPAIVTGSVAQFTGRDNRTAIVVVDTYGVDATRNITGGEFVFRTGRGTNQSPSAVQYNDVLGNFTAAGWANTGYGGVAVGGLKVVADENFTDVARGSRVEIYSTPKGTITPTRIVTIGDMGMEFNPNDVTGITNVDYMLFDTMHSDTSNTAGTLAWNTSDKTLNLHHPGGVTQQIGQETYGYVRNGTANTIPNGTAVQFSGAQMDGEARLLIAPMLANGTYPSLYGFGITTQDIAPGEDGFVTVWGKVRQLNTSAWNVGDILYVSPTVAGGLTNVKPTAPNNVIPIAAVLAKSTSNGEIFVRPTIEQKMSYGVFVRTTDFSPASPNTPYAVTLDTVEIQNGVTLGTPTSRIYVDQSGLYQIDVTARFTSTGNQNDEDTWYLWFRKDGVDIPNSMRRGGIDGEVPNGVSVSTQRTVTLNANSYVEVCIAVSDTRVDLGAAASTAFGPSTAAIEVNLSQIQL